LIIKLGEWGVNLNACTFDMIPAEKKIYDVFSSFLVLDDFISHHENELNHMAISSITLLDNTEYPSWLPANNKDDWTKFCAKLSDTLQSSTLPNLLDVPSFSWPYLEFSNKNLKSNTIEKITTDFFALVLDKPAKSSYIQIYLYIVFLAAIWHIQQGGLFLHSSGVARGQNGYLFLGQSEAGKSTVAQLSASLGYQILGDDLNFIIRNKKNHYLIAPAPSIKQLPLDYSTLRPNLRGVFKLVQGDKNVLIPMSYVNSVQTLFAAVLQTPKSIAFPRTIYKIFFQTISIIARSFPCYELHFRKSPDFWKLIDAEFGLE